MEIREEPIGYLERLGEIPIAFRVDEALNVSIVNDGLGGIALQETTVDAPWIKDYDAIGEGPTRWAKQFDVTNWGLLVAEEGDRWVGAAVIAVDTPQLYMLEGRADLAALWDIRVHPEERGTGIGTRLFRAAEDWARSRGYHTLKAETQNINVPACRFYQRMGCTLGSIDRFAYDDLPDETQLIWVEQL